MFNPYLLLMATTAACLAATPLAAQDTEGDVAQYPASYFAPYHPNTALDMIRHVPGFTFDPGDPTLRGLTAAAGNVVVDGKRLAEKTVTLDQVLDRIPASQVDRIELIRGDGAGIDMLGQPLVANVIRRTGGASSTAITLAASAYADGRFAPGLTIDASRDLGGGRRLTWSAGLSRYVETSKGDGTRIRTDGDGSIVERADIDTAAGGTTGNVRGSYELPGLGGQVRVNASLLWTDYRNHQRDVTAGQPPIVQTLDEDLGGVGGGQSDAELGLNWSKTWSAALDGEFTAIGRLGRKSYASLLSAPGADIDFAEHDRTSELLARARVRYRAAPTISIELNGEVARNRLDTDTTLGFNGFPIALPNAQAVVTEIRADLGTQLTWTPSNNIEIEAGAHFESAAIDARADQPQSRSYRYLKPRVQLSLHPGGGHQLRLKLERIVGQLDFANFVAAAALDKGTVAAGNVTIRPQTSWQAALMWEWQTPGKTSLSLDISHSWLGDAIDRIPVRSDGGGATFDSPGNIGSGRQDVARIGATTPLAGIGLSHGELKIDLSARRSRVTDPTTGTKRAISGEKPFELTATFHNDLPAWKAAWGLNLDVGSRSRTYLFNEVDTVSSTVLLGAFADWNPTSRLALHAEIGDVLGRDNRRIVDAYGGERGTSPLLYRDDRSLSLGPYLTVRLRRSL